MVKVSVLYPNSNGIRFDMAYYLNHHMPMVKRLLGTSLKGMAVEQGISGGEPGSSPSFIAAGHLLFDTVEAFQTSFGSHSREIMDDIPKYTNSVPTIQIGDVKL